MHSYVHCSLSASVSSLPVTDLSPFSSSLQTGARSTSQESVMSLLLILELTEPSPSSGVYLITLFCCLSMESYLWLHCQGSRKGTLLLFCLESHWQTQMPGHKASTLSPGLLIYISLRTTKTRNILLSGQALDLLPRILCTPFDQMISTL